LEKVRGRVGAKEVTTVLLAVDVGNTQTVIGLFNGAQLLCHWRMATNTTATADEIRVTLHSLLNIDGRMAADIDALALSSVVPELSLMWEEVADSLGIQPLVVSSTIRTGLEVRYDNPSEIGADRIADAVAARHLYGAPVVIVDLGTATNMEVIDREGAFIGGIIAPGLATSADALFNAAARLARFELEFPPQAVGRNTRDAVSSGLMFGEVARIDGLVQRVFDELGYKATVVATGGLAGRVAPVSRCIQVVNEDLTLVGLRLLYEMNGER